jgi:serine protease Do
MAAVLAGVLLLVNAGPMGTSDLSSTSSTTAGFTASSEAEPAAAARTARSLVALTVATAHGTEHGCAVAVAADGLLATTAATVDGATSVTALTASGQQVRATVMAVDAASDIALLEIPVRLPVPRFVPDTTVADGRAAMVLALASPLGAGSAHAAIATWSFGTVNSVGTTAEPGPGPGMAALVARVAGAPELPGEVLADPTGAVLGMFAHPSSGPDQLFIPTDLLLGVSTDLATTGRVAHGWLDVDGANLPTSTAPGAGALVDRVVAPGPSANRLQVGDVIVAVDGLAVRSMAELRARLYLLAAGTPVTLEIVRRGTTTSVTIHLAPSP